MQLEYDLTPQDYIEFNRHYIKTSPEQRRNKLQFFLTPAVAGLVLILMTLHVGDPVASGALLILPLGWLCLAPFLWRYNIRRRETAAIKKAYENGSEFFGRHVFTIGPEGMSCVLESAKVEMKWKKIKQVVAAENAVYIYLGTNVAHILPNRVFHAACTKEQFVEATLRYREQAAGIVEVA